MIQDVQVQGLLTQHFLVIVGSATERTAWSTSARCRVQSLKAGGPEGRFRATVLCSLSILSTANLGQPRWFWLCFSLEPRHFKRDTFWFSVVGLNAVACKLRHADDGPCNAQMTWRGRAPAILALFFPSLPFRRFSRLSGRELQECKTCLSGLPQHFQPVRLVYFVQDALQIKLEDWKQHPREAAQVLSLRWWVESSLVPATNRILTLDAGLAEDRAAKADSKIFAGPKIPVSPSSRGR